MKSSGAAGRKQDTCPPSVSQTPLLASATSTIRHGESWPSNTCPGSGARRYSLQPARGRRCMHSKRPSRNRRLETSARVLTLEKSRSCAQVHTLDGSRGVAASRTTKRRMVCIALVKAGKILDGQKKNQTFLCGGGFLDTFPVTCRRRRQRTGRSSS